MRLGPVIHGSLLAVALVLSYRGMEQKDTSKTTQNRGTHKVWTLSSISSIVLKSEKRTVRIEARGSEDERYLWGQVSISRVTSKKKAEPALTGDGKRDAGAISDEVSPTPASSDTKPKRKIITREFPIGEEGEKLLRTFQSLMALRDLGPITEDALERYNLHKDTMSLIVADLSETKHTVLLAGEKIYGGSDRYAYRADVGKAYVISGELLKPLESAEHSLGLRKVHWYKDEDVASMLIETSKREQVLVRSNGGTKGANRVSWERQEAPGKVDASLSSLIARVKRLKPTKYDASLQPEALVHLATFRYRDKSRTALGFLEIFREVSPSTASSEKHLHLGETQYYVRTERTHSLGKVSRLTADRIDQDLVQLFGIEPAPSSPPKSSSLPSAPAPNAAPSSPSD